MSTDQPAGRSLVSRRAIADIVRTATLGSYGVKGVAASPLDRLLGRLGLGSPAIRLGVREGRLRVELFLQVGHGLPIAEVARKVDSAVRYAIGRGPGRDMSVMAIHVNRLRIETGPDPSAPATAEPRGPGSGDLAGSGTDIAR